MFSIDVDTREAGRLLESLGRLPKGLKAGVAGAVRKAAQEIARDAKAQIRAGAAKRRRGGGSKPGEAPVSRTGALAKSIRAVRGRRDGLSWRVQSRFTGRFLELGTADRVNAATGQPSGQVAPRPFISRAFAARASQTYDEIVAAIERTLDQVRA